MRVTAEMRAAIRAAATKDGESEGVLVRKALRAYFDRRETAFLTKSQAAELGKARDAVVIAETPVPAAITRATTDQLNER